MANHFFPDLDLKITQNEVFDMFFNFTKQNSLKHGTTALKFAEDS